MPTIAAILFMVAYNMCQWRPFVKLVKTAPKSDILVLVVTFVLRMRGVPAIDASAVNALETLVKKCREGGIRLVLSHVNEQPMSALLKNGLLDSIGQENVCVHIDAALMRAEQILKEGQVLYRNNRICLFSENGVDYFYQSFQWRAVYEEIDSDYSLHTVGIVPCRMR